MNQKNVLLGVTVSLVVTLLAIGLLIRVLVQRIIQFQQSTKEYPIAQVTSTTTEPSRHESDGSSSYGNPQNSDNSASWPTYSDPLEGFSFRYPPECAVDNGTYMGVLLLDNCEIDVLAIRIYQKPLSQSVLDFWRSETDIIILSSTSLTVNGYPAIAVQGVEPAPLSGEGEQGGTSDLLISDGKSLILDFAPSPFDALAQTSDSAPEAILRSLQFL